MLVGWSGRGKTSLLKKLTEKGQTSMISGWHGNLQESKDKNVPIIRNWTCSTSNTLRSQNKIKRITFKTWDFPSLVCISNIIISLLTVVNVNINSQSFYYFIG